MANHSYTSVKIIDELPLLEDLRNSLICETGEKTEYDVLEVLGYSNEELDDMDLRGYIDYFELDRDEGILDISITHKWCSPIDFLRAIAEKFPDASIYYSTEETGCAVFETNDFDGEFFDKYIVTDTESEDQYFHDFDDLQKWAIDLFGFDKKEIDTFDKLKRKVEERDDDLSVYEFEIVDL